MPSFLDSVGDPNQLITPLGEATTFPESVALAFERYATDIDLFVSLAATSTTSAQLLETI
jgi:hypothetical protein